MMALDRFCYEVLFFFIFVLPKKTLRCLLECGKEKKDMDGNNINLIELKEKKSFKKNYKCLEKEWQKYITYEEWVDFDKQIRELSELGDGWDTIDKRMRCFYAKQKCEDLRILENERINFKKTYKNTEKVLRKKYTTYFEWVEHIKEISHRHELGDGWFLLDKRMRDYFIKKRKGLLSKEHKECEDLRILENERINFEKTYKNIEEVLRKKHTYESWIEHIKFISGLHELGGGGFLLDKRMRAFLIEEKRNLSKEEYAKKLLRICIRST